jgi:hypothetical protein
MGICLKKFSSLLSGFTETFRNFFRNVSPCSLPLFRLLCEQRQPLDSVGRALRVRHGPGGRRYCRFSRCSPGALLYALDSIMHFKAY